MKRLLALLAVGGLVSVLYLGGVLDTLEWRLVDARYRYLRTAASSDLIVVAIDPQSLRTLNVWPWPRGYHATVLENLLEAGAQQVAFDVDFSSRSIPGEDQELERALNKAGGRAILPVFVQREVGSGGEIAVTGTLPLPRFRNGTALASINIRPGRDGLARRHLAQTAVAGRNVPSLAAALAGTTPTDDDSFLVDFSIDPDTIPRLSYVDILTGQFDSSAVAGKVVVIGATAVELGDQVAVPLHAAMPGVLLQALAFESLRQDRALQRAGPFPTLLAAWLLCFLVGPVIMAASWRKGFVLILLLAAGGMLLSVLMQGPYSVLLDIVPWLLVLSGCYAVALVQQIDRQSLRLFLQELAIRRKSVLIEHVMRNSFDAIITINGKGCIETCNKAAEAMFAVSLGDLQGVPLGSIVETRQHEDYATGKRQDGTTFPLEMVHSQITLENQALQVVLLRDMTERRAQQAALEHQATHDALTDLPNRIMLGQRMRQSLRDAARTSSPLSFLVLDLDRFKEVNDTLGHHVGDLLLKQIARRLQKAQRPGNTIARLGGDEFAVLLPDSGLDSARQVAQDLLAALEKPFPLQGILLDIGVSIGIALFPEHGQEATLLLQRADVAMYLAKRERSGLAVYDTQKDFHTIRHLTLMSELRRAIQEDQLSLVYQPKLSCGTEQVIGVEALVRWDHPRHGRLPPSEFIPLAESTGLIKPLTRWVLGAALRQCARWRRDGLDLAVSVNLSAQNLKESDLPETVGKMLSKWQLPADCLVLEITESLIMENPERALQIVTQLDTMGILISIDDFGTGYSSLSYLKRLPATEIKIDRTFVMEMDRQRNDSVIVRSIIEMSHNLGLTVVAEGVETGNVWQTLKTLGCDYGQGNLFSVPLPAVQLRQWLLSRGDNLTLVADSQDRPQQR